MITTLVRLAIAGWILVTLARAGRAAWHQRALVLAVWRAWRLRHLAGVLGLMLLVGSVAAVLLAFVPFMDIGLGSLLGTETNAVFAPLEQAVVATGPPPTTGPDWALIGLSTVFLLPLALLLPWLAFVEEEVFRGGLEDESVPGQVRRALVFGLAHLVMLVPVGATLAIAVAGFVYGRIYLAAHAVAAPVPRAVSLAYRPGRRARRALQAEAAARLDVPRPPVPDGGVLTATVDPRTRQASGVFAAAVWHSAFNTAIVVVVWLSFVAAGFAGAA